ncbi:MAG: prepilin-type N-terminal cleavage/methylation domain-containing protein [Ignavibacteriales bacterium]
MKSNKGFTLIELLAVIVILAIIALIASPIIIGLIDDARKSAAANSAYGVYQAAENIYSQVLLASRSGLPDKLIYTFQTDGTAVISYGTLAVTTKPAGWDMDVSDVTLNFNGTKPTGGVLTLNKNGSVTVDSALIISGFTCTQTNGEFVCG